MSPTVLYVPIEGVFGTRGGPSNMLVAREVLDSPRFSNRMLSTGSALIGVGGGIWMLKARGSVGGWCGTKEFPFLLEAEHNK